MTNPSSTRRQALVICLGLFGLVALVFGQTGGFDFVAFDDNAYVYGNPVVRGGLTFHGLAWVFTHADCHFYHPLTMLSLMADAQFHGLNAGGFHLTNVLLHAGSTILLFLILREITGALWRSAFVAAVFAIHPLRVESVAWVAERKDVLGTFLFMVTIGTYMRYVRKPDTRMAGGLVTGAFALALLAKTTVVTLPFVLLLLDYWPLRRNEKWRLLLLEKWPLLALSVAAGIIELFVTPKFALLAGQVSLSNRLANAVVTYVVYLRQIFWPAGLAVPYPYPHHALLSAQTLFCAALLAGLSAVAWQERQRRPWLIMGWLWYLGMLLPLIGLVPIGLFVQADRFTYLPQIGIYLAVTWQVSEWARNIGWPRPAQFAVMAGAVSLLMMGAWKQISYWRNSETLFRHALACTTDNAVARANLGAYLLRQGRAEEAKAFYQNGPALEAVDSDSENNLGLALLQEGKATEAISHFQQAIALDPQNAMAHLNLGTAFLREGRVGDASVESGKAWQLKPSDPQIENNLAWLLATAPQDSLRDGKRAVDLAEAAGKTIGGENPIILRTLAAAYAEAGRFTEATATARQALKLARIQSNAHLSARLDSELQLYEAGQPLRIPAQGR